MMKTMKTGLLDKIRRFVRADSGMTLPAIAGALVGLMGFTGLAIDLARVQMVQQKLQFSVDAAGLAAAGKVSSTDPLQEYHKYLTANFNDYLGSNITAYDLTMNTKKTVFTLTASVSIPTTFMSLLGIHNVTFSTKSTVSRAVSGLELVFALDNTGSMGSAAGGNITKLQALKNATNTLLLNLFGDQTQVNNGTLWVGIVPFSQAVNIGTSRSNWIYSQYVYDTIYPTDVTDPSNSTATLDWGYGNNNQGWGGCVDAREPTEDTIDDPPTAGDPKTLFGEYWVPPDSYTPWKTRYFKRCYRDWTMCVDGYNKCYRDLLSCDNHNHCYPIGVGTGVCPAYTTCTYPNPQTYNDCYIVDSCTQNLPYYKCAANNGCSTVRESECTPQAGVVTCTQLDTYTQDCSYVTSCTPDDQTECTAYYNYNITSSKNPNKYCPKQITTMTNNLDDLTPAISAMTSQGNTEINEGLFWAWNMLSPRWRGVWGGIMDENNLPLDYNTTGMTKAVVLLTDGNNTLSNSTHGSYWYSHDGRTVNWSGSTYSSVSHLDQKTLALCTKMKAAGIKIYTIGLGLSGIDTDLLESCASGENFAFMSPTTDDLQNIFDQIGDSLSNLRISH